MPFPHVTAPHPKRDTPVQSKISRVSAPKKEALPQVSDIRELSDLPSCKISGHCDRCGRCEN